MTGRLSLSLMWQLPLAVALAALAAWATTTRPAPALVAVVVALLAYSILRNPEIGALLIVALVACVPRSVLFDRGLPLAGGSLKVTDLLLAATIGAWIAGRVIHPARFPLPSRSVSWLILMFLALAVFGVLTANEMRSSLKLALLELRPLLSYLLVFPLVSAARTWRRFDQGLVVMLAIAGVGAAVAIGQYIRGSGGAATFTGGAVRLQTDVYLMPLVAIVWAPVLIAYARETRARVAVAALAAVALGGVYFTFARGAWVALLVATPLTMLLMPPRRRKIGVRWLVSLLAVAVAGVFAFNSLSANRVSDPLNAGLKRIESVSSYRNDVSSRYRFAEWSEALDEIGRHPIFGIGLGNDISFTNPMFSPTYNHYNYAFSTYYIHNSYIWVALKLGLVAALVFFALIGRVLWAAFSTYRRVADPRARMVLLASLASLVAILVLSTTGPHLNVDNATPIVASVIAAVEIARRLAGKPERRAA